MKRALLLLVANLQLVGCGGYVLDGVVTRNRENCKPHGGVAYHVATVNSESAETVCLDGVRIREVMAKK